MKLETYLNAMAMLSYTAHGMFVINAQFYRRKRQYKAFRTRILKMFSIGRSINADLNTEIEMQKARITELEEWLEHSAGLILHYEQPDD